MNKKEIMEKYHLDESHSKWQDHIDNWYSVEAALQQLGRLPEVGDNTQQVMMDFLDNKKLHHKLLKERYLEFGSMYLSAKRALYRCLIK